MLRAMRFAIIGYGAITEEVLRCLEERSGRFGERGGLAALAGVLVRPQRLAEARRRAAGRFAVVDSIEGLLELGPGMVAECAGHGAMREHAARILKHGTRLLCTSVGVLADAGFAAELARAGEAIWIPSGAVAGIDGLLAARTAGLQRVTYTSIKPPPAWKGTPADKLVGRSPDTRITFFEGSAREAAIQYPQNVNVGATVSLAGLGLDRTQVRLVSDPDAAGPLGIIDAEGAFGTFRFEVLAYASPGNPKTSLLTAHSVLAALRGGVSFSVQLCDLTTSASP
jgi:aspartate dehydrogenase